MYLFLSDCISSSLSIDECIRIYISFGGKDVYQFQLNNKINFSKIQKDLLITSPPNACHNSLISKTDIFAC